MADYDNAPTDPHHGGKIWEPTSPTTLVVCGVGPAHEHDFKGWREFEDGLGGETVCIKCGMGAMAWSLRTGL